MTIIAMNLGVIPIPDIRGTMMLTDNDGNPLEKKMTYRRYEYYDLVQDTEVIVTLGIEHDSGDDGHWTDYFIA